MIASGNVLLGRALTQAFACVLLALAGMTSAWPAEVADLDADYTSGAKASYLQLLLKVFPGATRTDERELTLAQNKELRRPGTKERSSLPAGARLTGFDARWIRADGRRNLLLSFSASGADAFEPFIVMVVPEGASEPQDVADFSADRMTWMNDQWLDLGQDDAFIVSAAHHNSGQGYLIESVFHIREGRFRAVADLFTLNVNGGCQNLFTETTAWSTEPVPASSHARVRVAVTRKVGPAAEERKECGSRAKSRVETYRGSWTWNAARNAYVSEGKDDLARLGAINRKNL